ncbi:MAG: hypothetical protein IPK17_21235 [Chloroflexi bacterium]|uniref:hypothetical protein n=1 Tax=Candidatus Flexifilum breve TaxID=3140694 RepID=UPI0031376C63|nr:hypothetical protein [Chloroflexota bacterium]
MRSRFRPEDALLLLVALALTALYVLVAGGNFPLDDSWIHQTYARNLAQTGQWAFVPGVPSAASTSPLYTVVLTVGYWLNIPFRLWAHGLGAVMLGVTGMLGLRLAERYAPNVKRIGLISGLALVFTWHLIWAAASGMETPIFAMFTLLLPWLITRQIVDVGARHASPLQEDNPPQTILSAVVFGVAAALTTLTRAEGVLLVGLVGVVLLIVRPSVRTVRWGVIAGIAFALVLTPYLALNYSLTGGPLPNTAAAKIMYAQPYLTLSLVYRLQLMLTPLAAGGQLLLIPGLVAYLIGVIRRARQDRRWLLALTLPAWGFGLILLYAIQLPLNFQHGRYVMPALPALVLAGVVGTAWLIRSANASLIGRVLTRVLALSTAVIFVGFTFGLGLQAHVQDVTIIDEEMVRSAQYIAENIPATDLLAVHDIGAVGYFAPRRIIDTAGLVTPETIPFVWDDAGMWAYLREHGAVYLMGLEDQIPKDTDNAPQLCLDFTTGGQTAPRAGGSNMTIYYLAWAGGCP